MKLRIIHVLATLAMPPVLAACSSYTLAQPTEAPIAAFGQSSSKAATVCVIRPSHWHLQTTFVVRDDTQLVGATRGESYFCYLAEPGPHRILASRSDTTEEGTHIGLRAEAGHRYWLHMDFDAYLGTTLEWVDESRARAMVEACDYKELVDAPGEEFLPEAVPYARALSWGRRDLTE
jgi:hypothetical protein